MAGSWMSDFSVTEGIWIGRLQGKEGSVSPSQAENSASIVKTGVEGKITKFEHMIDSRTRDAATVVDEGENVEMEDGSIVERGKMINPATGSLMLYEEKWREEESSEGLVIRRKGKEETWQAIVGDCQLALGRYQDGAFWAWQARKKDGVWERVHATKNAMPEDSHWVILANE